MTRRIDFFISNSRHHWQAVQQASKLLAERGHDCRVFSLCELRGEQTPASISHLVPIFPVITRVPTKARLIVRSNAPTSRIRGAVRWLGWYLRVAPHIAWMLARRRPDVVALPNDLAYPFDRIVEMLSLFGIPWALYQEGILFRLPPSELRPYGAGGATAIAAWGQTAAEYFIRDAGAPESSVHVVGSPRHDTFARAQFEEKAALLRRELSPGHKLIVFFGTTVDKPGGHCTTAEKLAAIEQFAESLAPLMDALPFKLWVKPHPGECVADYEALFRRSSIRDHVEVRPDLATFPAVVASDAVIINGSSIGLEALLLGARVGVIPVPRTGYPFDFGTSGIHVPIPATGGTAAIMELLTKSTDDSAVKPYLHKHFANRPKAAENFANLLETM